MQPAVSVQDVREVSPAWLRPSAFVVILCLHWALLIGIRWPAGTNDAEPPPLEIQVIAQAEPAQLLVPLESAPVVEVKPVSAVPVVVEAVEAQPLHGGEVAELKPPEPASATSPPPGVLVSPELEAADLKPLAEASAVPVEPPRQGPLPSSEQPVAETEPLMARTATLAPREASPAEASALGGDPPSKPLSPGPPVAESELLVARPAAAPQIVQPAGKALAAVASTLAVDPSSKPLSPAPPVLESEPLVARPAAAPQIAQPAGEALAAVASTLAVDPSSRPLSPTPPVSESEPLALRPAPEPPSRPMSPEQQAAEVEPLAVRPPTAPVEVAQTARQAPRVEPSAVAIEPPSRPLVSEQQPAKLVPQEVPQAAAPVPVGPPTPTVPTVESSTVASSSPTPGAVLPSEEEVAKLEPYSPAAAPLQEEGPLLSGRIGKIVHYVEQYDGGRCFFVAPVAVTETEAKLEGYGSSARPFEALDTAFRHENGFEASIDVRLVNPAQCPAVTFLGRLRGSNAPRLRIDSVNLGPAEVLTGTVDGFGSRNVELLVATDAGTVQNMSHLLKAGANAKTFAIGRPDIAWASGGQPQLLIVVASPLPLKALRFDRPVAADRVFAAALGEAERTNQPIAAMARYFKLER